MSRIENDKSYFKNEISSNLHTFYSWIWILTTKQFYNELISCHEIHATNVDNVYSFFFGLLKNLNWINLLKQLFDLSKVGRISTSHFFNSFKKCLQSKSLRHGSSSVFLAMFNMIRAKNRWWWRLVQSHPFSSKSRTVLIIHMVEATQRNKEAIHTIYGQ